MTRSKKNPFVANHLSEKMEKLNMREEKRNNSNLVSGIYHYTHNDWPYNRYS
ncbi:unnamed protein product [Musa acuminata subsp. malaccensis]|nr:unnamed protein product [Musa acuminata subsp. malaccensis]